MAIVPDWQFDSRPVDLIGEGFGAAIGAGFAMSPGVVARELGPIHAVLVACGPTGAPIRESGQRALRRMCLERLERLRRLERL